MKFLQIQVLLQQKQFVLTTCNISEHKGVQLENKNNERVTKRNKSEQKCDLFDFFIRFINGSLIIVINS